MKKCFTINPLRTIDEIRSYHQLLKNGVYQGIEIFFPYNLDEDRLNLYSLGLKEIKEKYNPEMVMHLPHGPKNDLCDLEHYKEIVLRMKSGMDYASKFGIKKLTLHLGYVDKFKDRMIYLNHIVDILKDLCEYAKNFSMNIMIENMPGIGEVGYSPDEILSIINEVDRDNLKFILDTGHANVSEYKIDEYIDLLRDYLIHLHLNDNSGSRDEHARLGDGNIDFYGFIEKLKEVNYDQLYCMEILFKSVDDLIYNAKSLDKYNK